MTFDQLLDQARKNAQTIDKIAKKVDIDIAKRFPKELIQLNDCLDTYSAAKLMIAAVVKDATSPHDLNGWTSLFSNFDKNWDKFAKEYDEIFSKANEEQQANVLETFARNNFGDNVFEAGSVIKNESAEILSGISGFKGALGQFKGSFRNPVQAANKIRNGVTGIVQSTEKVADSVNRIFQFISKKRGVTDPIPNPVLMRLCTLSENKAVAGILSTMNIGTAGINTVSNAGALGQAIKNRDIKGGIYAGKALYSNIKVIISGIKNMAGKKRQSDLSRPITTTSQKPQTAASDSSIPSGPSYSYICSKAKIKCSNGDKISTLTVLPIRTIWLYGQPQANISDHLPMVNIAPCGKCHTTAYPPTGAATSANHGKLTPMPCVPNTPFPWMNGKNDVILQGNPALISTSKLKCVYGGTITITFDGQQV